MKCICKTTCLFTIVISLILSLGITSMAATSGSCLDKASFSVETKADWKAMGCESVTLKQRAYSYISNTSDFFELPGQQVSRYTKLKVTIKDFATEEERVVSFKSKSIKIKLGRDKTYLITVENDDSINSSKITPKQLCIDWTDRGSWWVDSLCKTTILP